MLKHLFSTSVAALACVSSPANGDFVRVDFNDPSPFDGNIAGSTIGSGDWAAGAWAGSTAVDASSGDLIAPASTNFALTQAGTARSVLGSNQAGEQVTRDFASAIGGSGIAETVWFSYLVQQNQVFNRVGITLNDSGTPGPGNASGLRILALDGGAVAGTGNILIDVDSDLGADVTIDGAVTIGQTALVLGKIELNVGGGTDDRLDVWIDPDVAGGEGGLGAPVAAVGGGGGLDLFGDDLLLAGITAHRISGGTAGRVDLFSLSSDANAFDQVTGVPEPSAFLYGGLISVLAGCGYRIKRRLAVA